MYKLVKNKKTIEVEDRREFVTPNAFIFKNIQQFPHCDQRILHAPGECEYCDEHPDWQALRLAWSIAFTGWTPDETKNKQKELPCPADYNRGDNHKLWPGNTARPAAPKEIWYAVVVGGVARNFPLWPGSTYRRLLRRALVEAGIIDEGHEWDPNLYELRDSRGNRIDDLDATIRPDDPKLYYADPRPGIGG